MWIYLRAAPRYALKSNFYMNIFSVGNDWIHVGFLCVSFSHGGRRLDHTTCVYVCVCVSLGGCNVLVCIVDPYVLRAYLCVCVVW